MKETPQDRVAKRLQALAVAKGKVQAEPVLTPEPEVAPAEEAVKKPKKTKAKQAE